MKASLTRQDSTKRYAPKKPRYFNNSQRGVLEDEFLNNQYPTTYQKIDIAQHIGVDQIRVDVRYYKLHTSYFKNLFFYCFKIFSSFHCTATIKVIKLDI